MGKNNKKNKAIINPRKILVIRTDRIGDVILTLPITGILKKRFPEAEIGFLVNQRTLGVVAEYPNINKVHTIEKVTVSGIKRVCRENLYDTAIVVYPRFAIALGIYLGGVKYRIGTAFRWYSFLFNMKHFEHRKDSVKHELEYNLALLNELGIENIIPEAPILPVSSNEIESAKTKLKEKGINTEKGFIVIHVPTLGSAKVWKDDNFRTLITLLLSDKDFTKSIILTGTAGDENKVNSIINSLPGRGRVIALLSLSLWELKAVIKLSDLFIGNSSGPIHIAAAVGTFVIGFYSPVKAESEIRWGPFTEKKKIFSPGINSELIDVMDEIKPEEVHKFIMQNLTKNI